MRINLIGNSFDEKSGQGIYRYSAELFKHLSNEGCKVVKNSSGDINHLQQPELIFKNLLKKNIVTTFHDVMPIFMNERKSLYRLFFYFSCLFACLKSKKIIAVSNCTKKDIIKYFPFAKNKIFVIYEGVDKEKFFPTRKIKKIKSAGYLGGLGKRKNVDKILIYALSTPSVKYKIAGKGLEKERLEDLAARLRLKNVEFVGFVPEDKLNEFYNSLDVFIFPSKYEGFGLPVVEAMACGLIILSEGSSINELRPDYQETDSIEKLSKKSIERAAYFDWKKTAIETKEVYNSIC